VIRATQNFPNHKTIARITITVEGVEASWLPALSASLIPLQNALLSDLSVLRVTYPDELRLREAWATRIIEFVANRGADPIRCGTLLDDLAALHAVHPNEPRLRAIWAVGVTNLTSRRAAHDPAGWLGLLDALARLYTAYPDEPRLREEWANGEIVLTYHGKSATTRSTGAGEILPILYELAGVGVPAPGAPGSDEPGYPLAADASNAAVWFYGVLPAGFVAASYPYALGARCTLQSS
jgi:hypothetical protein